MAFEARAKVLDSEDVARVVKRISHEILRGTKEQAASPGRNPYPGGLPRQAARAHHRRDRGEPGRGRRARRLLLPRRHSHAGPRRAIGVTEYRLSTSTTSRSSSSTTSSTPGAPRARRWTP